MTLRLRAPVKAATGKTRHALGTIIEGTPLAVQDLPMPAWVEIVEEEGAFYLLYFNAEGTCLTDTWHETLAAAKRQAQFEFEISPTEWETI